MHSYLVTCIALATWAQATPLEPRGIIWKPCEDPELATSCTGCDCGLLSVPLDYSNSSSPAIELSLLRIHAQQQPSRGSVIFNFGGPGEEARHALAASSPLLHNRTGGIYDLVAFDPRGVGTNLPITCIEDEPDVYSLRDNFKLDPERSPERLWAASKVFADRCERTEADVAPFIGTAAVARDLMSVVDNLDEDGLLRFWGFSYGTVLAATAAAMFPDRIDRIVLDGNVNLHEYYNGRADYEAWTQSDKIFSDIWSLCIDAGPELCSLAGYNNSKVLESKVWDLIESTISDPIIITGTNGTFALDYNLLKQVYSAALYGPSSWPSAVAITSMLLDGATNTDDLYDLLALSLPLTRQSILGGYTKTVSATGIRCADRVPRVSNLVDFTPTLTKLRDTSRIVGDLSDSNMMTCAQWPFEAVERYAGPWVNISTRNPVLLVGNTFDAHTPLASTYNSSAAFQAHAVLEVEAYGHSTLAVTSKCVDDALQMYFLNGTLPEQRRCQSERQPYHDFGM